MTTSDVAAESAHDDDKLPDKPHLQVQRYKQLQRGRVADLYDVLDCGLIAHVGFSGNAGKPMVIPMAYARDGDAMLMHGSTGAGLSRSSGESLPLTATVSIFDGLVYAESLFDSTVNYRCAMVFGSADPVPDDERLECVKKISDHLMPGRWNEVRPPTKRELAATYVLRLPLDNASVKIRAGAPTGAPVPGLWTGYVPFSTSMASAVTQDGVDAPLAASVEVSRQSWGGRLSHVGLASRYLSTD
ncbi:pyridoxamine 5'-phosphate oxidase family protein [Mycobacterium sp. AZCC_0083]|uniref:pyridoxamine 5'-phosphate oxidase family protein n=1 Tax=Mycobacterium sp. AZCC_0083 TaxID=2735882 RepID=UPI00161BD28B|nr:pyridoxamine 5'-phosphate oxidase family protein [Mycobacterium sp. AZCC_0083]MBB5167536.1 hypothetical protein [Mycobacterium sp. AZCC_0083]